MEKEKVDVVILTPYLSESLGEFFKDGKTVKDFVEQVAKYGYTPINLSGVDRIETQSRLVNLLKPDTHRSHRDQLVEMNPRSTLVIAGSTKDVEGEVAALRGTGLVVARYSVFYGGPSNYTGKTPQETGYSLDIPKIVPAVLSLVSSDEFFEGLKLADADKINSALKNISRGNESTPIRPTPYLTEALKFGGKK